MKTHEVVDAGSLRDKRLAERLSRAQLHFRLGDPNACLLRLRQFTERAVQVIAASRGIYPRSPKKNDTGPLLNELSGALPPEISKLLHGLLRAGNDASHGVQELKGDNALPLLKDAEKIATWFHDALEVPIDFEQRNQKAFERVVTAFKGYADVISEPMVSSRGLHVRVSGHTRVFATFGPEGFLVKLPSKRVGEVVAAGLGRIYDPELSRRKEWVVVGTKTWTELARDAYMFVKAGKLGLSVIESSPPGLRPRR